MNIYQNLYDIIQQYIFGGAELTANMDLVATLTATWGVMFLIAIPFILVWSVIRMITR